MRHPASMLAVLLSIAAIAPGCGGNCGDLSAGPNEDAHTVLSFSWSSESDATIDYIEYGFEEGGYELSTPDIGAAEGSILGLTAFQDVFYRVVSTVGGSEQVCEGTASTLGLPAGLPDLDVYTYDASRFDDSSYLIGAALGDINALFIMDRSGDWVWYREGTEDIHSDVAFVEGSNDVYFNTFSEDHGVDIGTITRYSMEGTVEEEIRTEYGHHGFTQKPDGTIAYMAVIIQEWDGEDVVGDAIVEIAPDGTSTTVWSAWDWREPQRHMAWDNGFYPQGADWTHANALGYYPDTDTYLFSLGNLDIILEIDATTGEVLREFGGEGYSIAEGSTPFDFQHDTNWTDAGTLIMSSRFTTYDENDSKLLSTGTIEYAVDDASGTLTEIWRFSDGDRYYAPALGMGRRLANGNTMVNYGSAGVIQEVTPDGEIVWEVTSATGSFFGHTELFSDIYAGE